MRAHRLLLLAGLLFASGCDVVTETFDFEIRNVAFNFNGETLTPGGSRTLTSDNTFDLREAIEDEGYTLEQVQGIRLVSGSAFLFLDRPIGVDLEDVLNSAELRLGGVSVASQNDFSGSSMSGEKALTVNTGADLTAQAGGTVAATLATTADPGIAASGYDFEVRLTLSVEVSL